MESVGERVPYEEEEEDKNIFPKFKDLVKGNASDMSYSKSTLRTFPNGIYIQGITINNYVQASQMTQLTVNNEENSIYCKWKNAGNPTSHGVGIPISDLEENTEYVLSWENVESDAISDIRMAISYYDSAGNLIGSSSLFSMNNTDGNTFTIKTGAKYSVFVIRATGSTLTYLKIKNIKLIKKSDIVEEYDPGYKYKVPVILSNKNNINEAKLSDHVQIDLYLDEPLRKIGDYADYVDLQNRKVVRNIMSKMFKNYQSMIVWTDSKTTSSMGIYYNGKDVFGSSDNLKVRYNIIISNYFKVADADKVSGTNFTSATDKYVGYMRMPSTRTYIAFRVPYLSLTDFGNWLTTISNNGQPMYVNFALVNSVEESINSRSLNTVDISKYKNIFVDTAIQPSRVVVQ